MKTKAAIFGVTNHAHKIPLLILLSVGFLSTVPAAPARKNPNASPGGVLDNFEPTTFSTRHAKVRLLVAVDSDKLPVLTVQENTGTAADEFYAEQAVWETSAYAGLPDVAPQCVLIFNGVMKKNTRSLELCSKDPALVRLHMVPYAAGDFTNQKDFGRFYHSEENILEMPVANCQSKDLHDFRIDWAKIIGQGRLKPTTPVEELTAEGKTLSQKYSVLFKK